MNTLRILLRKVREQRTHISRSVWLAKCHGAEHRGRSAAEAVGVAVLHHAAGDGQRLIVSVEHLTGQRLVAEGGAA